MTLIRTIDHTCSPVGGQGARDECEATWDGTDSGGLRLANGVYFYVVDTGSEKAWGKIQILE